MAHMQTQRNQITLFLNVLHHLLCFSGFQFSVPRNYQEEKGFPAHQGVMSSDSKEQ